MPIAQGSRFQPADQAAIEWALEPGRGLGMSLAAFRSDRHDQGSLGQCRVSPAFPPAMQDEEPMAVALSTQLERLHHERERLEELLMLDASWRALRQLEASAKAGAAGHPSSVQEQREVHVKALASNRIFAARTKLLETIALLASDHVSASVKSSPSSLASRIVLLSEPTGEQFRARLRMKTAEAAPGAVLRTRTARVRVRPQQATAAMPDALELIEGLGRRAVEQLLQGGVTRFAEIAGWTSSDVHLWRTRLEGLAKAEPGRWIEQAAVLATGRPTRFADRARRGEYACLVASPPTEPPRAPLAPEARTTQPVLAGELRTRPVDAPPRPATTSSLHFETEPSVKILASRDARRDASHDMSRVVIDAISLPSQPGAALPPPLPLPLTGIAMSAEAQQSGYVRPAPPPAAAPDDTAGIAPAGRTTSRTRRLVERLQAVKAPDRVEASSYAAYRGRIEEASVTIRGVAEGTAPARTASTASEGSAANGPDPSTARGPSSRFLRALTGKP
jgi:predicted flap endonuclease-1-like 5' DNA nuclease